MKSNKFTSMATLALMVIFTLVSGTVKAQTFSTAEEALLYFESNAQLITTIANQTNGQINALKNAVKNGNDNLVAQLIPSIAENLQEIEMYSCELNTGYYQAEALNPAARNLFLLTSGSRIEGLGDLVERTLVQFQAYYAAGNTYQANRTVNLAFNIVTVIHDVADDARDISRDVRKSL